MSNWSEPIDIISEQQGGGGQGSSSLPGSIIAAIVGVVVFLVLAVGVTLLVVFLYLNHHRRAKLLASLKVFIIIMEKVLVDLSVLSFCALHTYQMPVHTGRSQRHTVSSLSRNRKKSFQP